MHKICIWTPLNTHLQSSFHDAIIKANKLDLQVCYFKKIPHERLELGWENKEQTKIFEKNIYTIEDALLSVPDFKERTHIISGNGYAFTKKLIDYCIANQLSWIIWVERSGIQLFNTLGQNSILFNMIYPIYRKLHNRNFAKKIDKHAAGFFASGIIAEEDYFQRGVSKSKIKHLYYALKPLVRSNIVPEKLKNHQFKRNFIYVGSLNQRKAIDILLKAVSKLDNSWGLILVGKDSDDDYYQEMAENLKIHDKVLFTGAINIKDINQYLSFSDVFILPSRFDGWGAVLNEAASLGMPLISTHECGGAHHLINNNENGYRVKANSVQELYIAMNRYIKNDKLVASHGAKSNKLFQEFTVEASAERLFKNLFELNIIKGS
ncbi:glycosyltransferase family 4 protein [bacterium]|nr:glycosyltransferase family 4 protein [bacterium]MBU1433413.1 glycosyltransferase family 4 protein [bacterium]